MQSKATSVEQYMDELPDERRAPMKKLRSIIKRNLPAGFKEVMCYGMIGWVVPHEKYPEGYHCNPNQPLPFINLASQKNYIAVYHMGLYANPDLLKWFQEAHTKTGSRKLDMGKSCLRYKQASDIPYDLIGELVSKVTPDEWINWYEKATRKMND